MQLSMYIAHALVWPDQAFACTSRYYSNLKEHIDSAAEVATTWQAALEAAAEKVLPAHVMLLQPSIMPLGLHYRPSKKALLWLQAACSSVRSLTVDR